MSRDDGEGAGEFHVVKGLEELFKPEQMRGDDQFHCDKCTGKHDAERGVRLRTMPPIVTIHLKRFAIQTNQDRKGRTEMSLIKVNTPVHFHRTLDFRPFVAASKAIGTASSKPEICPPADASLLAAGSTVRGTTPPTATGEQHQQSNSGGECGDREEESVHSQEEEAERPSSLLYDLYAVLMHSGSLEKGHYIALAKDVTDDAWYRFDDEKVTKLSEEVLRRELRKAYGGRGSTSAYMLFYREKPIDGGSSLPPSPNDKVSSPKGGGTRSAAVGTLSAVSATKAERGTAREALAGGVVVGQAKLGPNADPHNVELQAGHAA